MWNAFRAWQALREKSVLLEQARQEAVEKQTYLAVRHQALEAQVEKDKQSRETVKQQANGFCKGKTGTNREDSKAAAKSALDSLKQFTLDQQNLADRGRRLQDEQDLNDIYGNWISLVEAAPARGPAPDNRVGLWILIVIVRGLPCRAHHRPSIHGHVSGKQAHRYAPRGGEICGTGSLARS